MLEVDLNEYPEFKRFVTLDKHVIVAAKLLAMINQLIMCSHTECEANNKETLVTLIAMNITCAISSLMNRPGYMVTKSKWEEVVKLSQMIEDRFDKIIYTKQDIHHLFKEKPKMDYAFTSPILQKAFNEASPILNNIEHIQKGIDKDIKNIENYLAEAGLTGEYNLWCNPAKEPMAISWNGKLKCLILKFFKSHQSVSDFITDDILCEVKLIESSFEQKMSCMNSVAGLLTNIAKEFMVK